MIIYGYESTPTNRFLRGMNISYVRTNKNVPGFWPKAICVLLIIERKHIELGMKYSISLPL